MTTPPKTPATPVDTVLQKGAIAPAQKEQTGSSKAVSLIDSLLTKATLPVGTTISPQLQNVGTNELMATQGVSGTLQANVPTAPTAPTIAAPGTVTGTQITGPAAQAASQFTAAEEAARDAEEKAWSDAAPARALADHRAKRNRLLAETDY